MKYMQLLSLLSFMFLFTSCDDRCEVEGNGLITSNSLGLSAFSKLEVEGDIQLYVHEANQYSAQIITDSNILPYVETIVAGGVLYVRLSDAKCDYDETQLTVHVYAPHFIAISTSGDVDMMVVDTLHASFLEVRCSGDGTGTLNFSGGVLSFEMVGNGDYTLTGDATDLYLAVQGNGHIHAVDMPAPFVDAEITGNGDVWVWPTEILHASILGNGHIYYAGNPLVTSETNGNGSIQPF